VIVYHVGVVAADDYLTRRESHRPAHLERIVALRDSGLCLAGGPSPDGRIADLFYRVEQPGDVTRLVEEDPYYKGGVWKTYTAESFANFLEPWQMPPVVIDGSRSASLVEGLAADVEMASFALIEARGAGRMTLGGFFADGRTLCLMRASDPDEAVQSLRNTDLWKPETLRGRPFLHVL
jgi:uncharacterized protein YciI